LTGPRSVNSTSFACICATDIDCKISIGIYDIDDGWLTPPTFIHHYTAPGLFAGCSATDSVMLSTLECYYSDSDCLSILMNYTKQTYIFNVEHPLWFDVHPLIYDRKLSRFPPNTSILTIIKELMIERWNPSSSYDRFYKLCAPSYCTYSKRIRPKIPDVIIKLVSMIGGLTFSLGLITPRLVQFILYLLTKFRKRQQQQQQQQQQQEGNC
jgi:hypothetical protein